MVSTAYKIDIDQRKEPPKELKPQEQKIEDGSSIAISQETFELDNQYLRIYNNVCFDDFFLWSFPFISNVKHILKESSERKCTLEKFQKDLRIMCTERKFFAEFKSLKNKVRRLLKLLPIKRPKHVLLSESRYCSMFGHIMFGLPVTALVHIFFADMCTESNGLQCVILSCYFLLTCVFQGKHFLTTVILRGGFSQEEKLALREQFSQAVYSKGEILLIKKGLALQNVCKLTSHVDKYTDFVCQKDSQEQTKTDGFDKKANMLKSVESVVYYENASSNLIRELIEKQTKPDIDIPDFPFIQTNIDYAVKGQEYTFLYIKPELALLGDYHFYQSQRLDPLEDFKDKNSTIFGDKFHYFLGTNQYLQRVSRASTEKTESEPLTGENLRKLMIRISFRIASLIHLEQILNVKAMAETGLYLSENDDKEVIRCYACSFAISRDKWPEDKDLVEFHKSRYSACPLVLHLKRQQEQKLVQ